MTVALRAVLTAGLMVETTADKKAASRAETRAVTKVDLKAA